MAPALQVSLALSLLTLGLGYWLKARCLDQPWNGGYEFRHFCYNDLYPLYYSNGYAAGEFPYVTVASEYPVITGLLPWVLGQMFEGLQAWWHANAVALLLAGLAVTWLLHRAGHGWRSAAPWVLAPSLVVDGFTNWDLWAIVAMVGGLVAFARGHHLVAGIAIGLGTAAKLFPAFAGLAMLLVVVNQARGRTTHWANDRLLRRQGVALASGFTLGWLPVNLPFMFANTSLWLRTYEFHRERGTSFQSIYYLYDQYISIPRGHALSLHEFNVASTVLTAAAVAAIAAVALRRRGLDVHALACAFVAASIVTGKFFSPQYVTWLLPLLVLAGLPQRWWVVLTASHVVGYVWMSHFRMPQAGASGGTSPEFLPLLNGASLVLMACMAGIAIAATRLAALPRPEADGGPPSPPMPDAGPGPDGARAADPSA